MTSIIIAEKNKAAQAIAEALGPVQKIDYAKGVPVYYVTSRNIYVIPLRGHIQQYENNVSFKKWTDRDPREIITDPNAIEKIPASYAGPFIKALKDFAQKSDLCIIGTDADVEGCNIGLMDAFPFIRKANPKIEVKQLWLSDLQKRAVQQAFNNLIQPKWTWAESGEARSIIDAIVGFSATREVSLTLQPILKAVNVPFTSIGRVQTCLLYLLYLREEIIRNFQPTPFWTISAEVLNQKTEIKANHTKNNFVDKPTAEAIYNKIHNAKIAEVIDVKRTPITVNPPIPLNTNRALVLLTQELKISADQALKTMEELYLNKILSYPRTDSDIYPSSYDHLELLSQFATHKDYMNYTLNLLQSKHIIPRQGKLDAGDHPPITPLISLDLNSNKFENPLQQKAYDILSRHYLALFGEPAQESETKILLSIDQELFIAKHLELISPGFMAIAPFLSKQYDGPLSTLQQKQILPVKKVILEEKQTQPPPRYTDTTLLKLMEQKNIGTKSTRPSIIQILLDRQYIERKQRSIFVKELGFLLIENLKEIWLPFLDPQYTQNVEAKLEEIRQSTNTLQNVVDELKREFLQLFDAFRGKKQEFIQKMDKVRTNGNVMRGRNNQVVGSTAKTEPLTKANCPNCKKVPMKLVKTQQKKKFIACSDPNCKTFLSLPQSGNPFLLKTQCSLCGFDVVKITTRKNNHKIEYCICPLCWTAGLKNQSGEGFCSNCKSFKIENKKCIKR